jgi:hypothetical protein
MPLWAHPEGIVREVVFPVVGVQTLRDLVRESKASEPTYRTTLRTVIRNSYSAYGTAVALMTDKKRSLWV